jgi:hypothetical protein
LRCQKSRIEVNQVLMNFACQRINEHQGGLNRTPQVDSPGILTNTTWTKLLLLGRASSIIPDSVRCVLHIRGEVNQDAYVNSTLFHFTTCLGLRNTTQTVYLHILQYWVQEFHLYIQIVRIL